MEQKNNRPVIGITVGDTNGVGPELILDVFSNAKITKLCTPVIYGSGKFFSKYRKQFKYNFNYTQIASSDNIIAGKVNMMNAWEEDIEIQIGTPTQASGKASFESLKSAMKDLKHQKIDAVVTAPISKINIRNAGFNFPGHTEYLTKEAEANDSLMFMISDELKVGVVTGHIPLEKVKTSVTKELILRKANLMFRSLKNDFGIAKPKIALLGLNPHAGENGELGKEEIDVVGPAIEALKQKGVLAYGPYPADGFFGSNTFTKFDGVLAMYHDQGLIPFKALTFSKGVNYTAGLNVIRTSPDHGTAFDIAGKGAVNASSFKEALYKALDIVKVRSRDGEPILT